MKRISEVMTKDTRIVRPDQTIQDAAKMMADEDIGSLPVGDNDRLVGMITDRDIALRAVARGLGVDTPIRDVMSSSIKYCYDDQDVSDVAINMAEQGVRRLPVVNRDKRLVGIVALSNIAHRSDAKTSQSFVKSVAKPH